MTSRIARTLPLVALALLLAGPVWAEDSPVGLWKTIDDDKKTAKSHVRIFERDGVLRGYIAFLFRTQTWHLVSE